MLAAVAGASILAGAGLGIWQTRQQHETGKSIARTEAAVSSFAKFRFTIHAEPKPMPAPQFVDDAGHHHALDEFRGKLVLLNIWATWCPPCREEMPTLDRLQQKLGGMDFAVVPLSIDAGDTGVELVRKFYRAAKVEHLPIFVDSSARAADKLGTVGLPTTLLIGRDGRELGRTVGPADWNGASVEALIRDHLGASVKRDEK